MRVRIRNDVMRRWSVLTTLGVLSCSVLLVLMRLARYGFLPGVMRDWMYVLGCYLLLACYIVALASLVRRGVARIFPTAALLLLFLLGWTEMVTAMMWLPFALTEILHRL